MQHFTIDDILSNHIDWKKVSTIILSKKLLKYKVNKPQEGKITIEFEYEDNTNFSREFFYIDNDVMMGKISNQEPINLKYYYIKDFDYKKVENKNPIKEFTADFAFFDDATSFESATFSAEASFEATTFGGIVSFEATTFSDKASFKAATFSDEASFKVSTFSGEASFERATFSAEGSFKAATFGAKALFDYATFSAEASFVVATFGDEASFERATFSAEASFYSATFGGKVSFERATFSDEASFKAATISDESSFDYSTFSAEASFGYAIFSAKASFVVATFGGEASFEGAIFSGETSFGRATFSNDASFYSATFSEEASFEATTFDNKASFKAATFSDEASFEATTFSDEASFKVSTFSGEASFERATFDAKASFEATTFSDEASFNCVNFNGETEFYETKFINGVNFKNCKANSIIFKKFIFQNDDEFEFESVNRLAFDNCIIKSTFNLKNYTDYSVHPSIERPIKIEKLSFKNMQNLGRINIDWDKNEVEKAINNNGDTYEEKKEQFAMLKENYHNIGDYASEDKAFVAYMRCRRDALSNWFAKTLDELIEIIGEYGTKPSRIINTMIIIWLFFGVIFTISAFFNGILSNGNPIYLFNGFYFSAITFFTIGYGDIVPACLLVKILAPIEGALGLFLMSYFTVAVVRKTLR